MIDVIPTRIEFDRPVNFGPGRTVDSLRGGEIANAALADGWLMLRLTSGTVHAIPSARVHCMDLLENSAAPEAPPPVIVTPPNGSHDSAKPGKSSFRRR